MHYASDGTEGMSLKRCLTCDRPCLSLMIRGSQTSVLPQDCGIGAGSGGYLRRHKSMRSALLTRTLTDKLSLLRDRRSWKECLLYFRTSSPKVRRFFPRRRQRLCKENCPKSHSKRPIYFRICAVYPRDISTRPFFGATMKDKFVKPKAFH